MKTKTEQVGRSIFRLTANAKTAYITAVKEKANEFVLQIPVSILTIIAEKGKFNGS